MDLLGRCFVTVLGGAEVVLGGRWARSSDVITDLGLGRMLSLVPCSDLGLRLRSSALSLHIPSRLIRSRSFAETMLSITCITMYPFQPFCFRAECFQQYDMITKTRH